MIGICQIAWWFHSGLGEVRRDKEIGADNRFRNISFKQHLEVHQVVS